MNKDITVSCCSDTSGNQRGFVINILCGLAFYYSLIVLVLIEGHSIRWSSATAAAVEITVNLPCGIFDSIRGMNINWVGRVQLILFSIKRHT